MTAPLLAVDGLNAHYGRAHTLFDVTLAVGRGEVVALMGRNGAGKSTTLKTVMGLVPTSAGTVAFDGAAVTGEAPFRICQQGLGYVPEERRIFTDLTVEENLEVGRQKPRSGTPEWTRERLYEIFPNLANMRGRRASQMSGGEQQMLTIARTLMGNPVAVLLDEPSEGLAPVIVEQMARTISSLKAEGLSLLLCEQNLHFANAVSDRAYVMEAGHIRYEGTMADLYADDEVRQAYLTV
jgi:branched-chain amino acid transport system ATP-binding protein